MLKPERICSLFPVRRSTRIRSVSSARALWLAKERAAPPLACRKYKSNSVRRDLRRERIPFGGDLAIAFCVVHPYRSLCPADRGDQRLTVRRAIAIPSSSVGPEVIR